MKRTIRQTVFPILTAFIWGTAFTAQSVGADYVGPLTFNALRSLIAFFALLVLDLAAARLIPGRRSLFQLAKRQDTSQAQFSVLGRQGTQQKRFPRSPPQPYLI